MPLINQFSALLLRGSALAANQQCCCPVCCGLPPNCTLCANILFPDGFSKTDCFDPVALGWVDQETGGPPFFMPQNSDLSEFDCSAAFAETQDPGYLSCCVQGVFGETPTNEDCFSYLLARYARWECTSCCGSPTFKGIGCAIVEQISIAATNGPNCEQYFPTITFSLNCQDENCNEFP